MCAQSAECGTSGITRKRMKTKNADVPAETIVRHLAKEIGELKSEICHLKHVIEQKDRAIEDFKKWQSRVAFYHCKYWLNEGMRLAQNPPEIDPVFLATVKGYLGLNTKFDMYHNKLTALIPHMERMAKTIQEKKE